MRGFLVVVVVVLLLILGGWLVIENRPESTNIIIDKQEIQEDTAKALDKIDEAAEGVTEEVDEEIDFDDEPASP